MGKGLTFEFKMHAMGDETGAYRGVARRMVPNLGSMLVAWAYAEGNDSQPALQEG